MDNWLASRDVFFAERGQDFEADTRSLHLAPLSHGAGLHLLPALFRGGCTVTQNTPDLKLWCRNVEAEKVTASLLLPTLMYRLLDLPEASQYDLSTFRTCNYGGAPISPGKLEQLRALEQGIRIRVWETTHSSLRIDSPEDVPGAVAQLRSHMAGRCITQPS